MSRNPLRLHQPRGWRRALRHGEAVVVVIDAPGPDPQSLAKAWKANRRRPLALYENQGPQSSKRFSLIGGEPLFVLEGRKEKSWLVSGRRRLSLDCSPEKAMRLLSLALKKTGLCAPAKILTPLMGWLSYEAGGSFEKLPSLDAEPVNAPDWMFFLPGEWAWYVPSEKHWRFACLLTSESWKKKMSAVMGVVLPAHRRVGGVDQRLAQWKRRVASLLTAPVLDAVSLNFPKTNFKINLKAKQRYTQMVGKARRYISAGDVFQVNLSHRMSLPYRGDSFELYRRLSAINPSPYGAWIDTGDLQLVSASPERLFKQEGSLVSTFPIAGTRPRSEDKGKDKALEKALHASVKERAEHLMLVDLERNDLGRVCRTGTVRVTDFMIHERYSHVQHIVSRVQGRLKPGLEMIDVLAAGFPGGTITGCPKIRCMEIIGELEKEARGLYTGSLGYWDPWSRQADFNILIRGIVLKKGRGYFQVGAGIVADSSPVREWKETLHKAEAMRLALSCVG